MELTRREAFEFLAGTAAIAIAEQSVMAQQPASQPLTLSWLGGDPPPVASGVSFGVPFPRGSVAKNQTFTLLAPGGKALPLQSWPLAYWPDGSMKFIGFAAITDAGIAGDFRLTPGPAVPVTGPQLTVRENPAAIEIDTGALQCVLPRQGANFIGSMKVAGREVVRGGCLVCTLEDRSTPGALRFDDFKSDIRSVTAEQSGPVRAVVKIEGVHKAGQGNREWLPFIVRLYFYAGQEHVRLIHTIVFDGDHEKDFIRGLGVVFTVPMREQFHNRHVQFSGEDNGIWAEPVQPATGRRPLILPGGGNALATQMAGQRLPDKASFNAGGQKLLTDWAVWDSYKLVQSTADGFVIRKRTNPQSCWLDPLGGKRSSGMVFAGDVSGGLSLCVKNMWQSYPASLEVTGAATGAADVHAWLWSPDADAMDLRHYDTKAHDLDSSYEDVQEGFSTPHGVARTSELTLFPRAAVPTHEDSARFVKMVAQSPLLAASPASIHAAGVFGTWSLPDRGVPAKATLEDRLDAAFAYYRGEVEQRHWYGFWNYGDVMHQHDGARHEWRYDVGGYAWDNTELGTDMWMWYHYLRTGRAEAFRMAEAMTRHTSEVDCYHLGRFAGLGSRHNVRHWGDGAKESRISQAAYRRFYYYLTTDERTGDLMRSVVDIDYKLLELDPMRLASPQTTPIPWPARVRGGPDWLAFIGNWMTEWERTGEPKYRDKILAGMDSIAAMPFGFMTGPNQLYGYEPATGKLHPIVDGGFGTYNLTTIMGGAEVVFELNELIDHPAWKKTWLQYCRLVGANKDVLARDQTTGAEGADGRFASSGRLAAYVYRETKNAAFGDRAWARVHLPTYSPVHLEAPAVMTPIDEIAGLSTNSTSQNCLETIELLEMCADRLRG